jgi:His/Glu/Gln/Arg/opine family amino acid ABC transporter permease subunit
MATDAADLGPFAPEQGPASLPALGGALLGVVAFALAAGAVALDLINASDYRSRPLVMLLAPAAVLLCIAGLYQVSASGRRGVRLATWGLGLAALGGIVSFVHSGVQNGTLQLAEFGTAYLNREIFGQLLGDMRHAAWNTLRYAAISEVLGIALGLVVATFAVSERRWLRIPATAYVDVVRGLPLLMMLLLIYFGLTYIGITLETVPALIIGLTINSSAYIAEIFRAGIQSVERGQMDAARSLGMPYAVSMIHVVIPQAVRRVIPPLTNEFIALVKDTSLMFALGATVASRELLITARQAASETFSATPYMAASLFYLAITIPLIRLVSVLEKKLNDPNAVPIRVRLQRRARGAAGRA